MLGVGIGIVKKVGDKVRGGIGVGDGDVIDKPSVSVCADFCSEVGCILGDCTSGVEEGWLGPAIWDDGGMVGDVEDGVRDITHSKNPKPKFSQSCP